MKNNEPIKKIHLSRTLLILTFITIVIVTCFSLSKYETTISGSNKAIVATPILNMLSNNSINMQIKPFLPGEKQEFLFELSNEKDEKKNEVSLEYTIQLDNLANLPLEFSLYKYNENTSEYEQLNLKANITDKIEMNVNETKNHKYKLEAKWKENTDSVKYDSYEYSKTIDYIKITVNATQID